MYVNFEERVDEATTRMTKLMQLLSTVECKKGENFDVVLSLISDMYKSEMELICITGTHNLKRNDFDSIDVPEFMK